jgi:DAK2 domain fusion protein YloV
VEQLDARARDRLGPEDLKATMSAYREALRLHQERLNRLNVYPVPDGDTGTNMALTMESVVAGCHDADDMAGICHAISHGSLMGARGNSGVILSQVLRGLAEALKGSDDIDGRALASGLSTASEAAYGAVMRPVEGTILTAVREASAAAVAAANEDGSLVDVIGAAQRAAHEAVATSPELLPVLRDAGVVDAGAAGFALLLDAFVHVVVGEPLPEPEPVATAVPSSAHAPEHPEGVSDLRYEVMYLLDAPDETIPAFKDVWTGIGDSIVVVGGGGLWNCHIHTDDIGAAIEAGLDCGRPRSIRVTDLAEQVEEERWVREAATAGAEAPAEPVPTAVVAVATGEGLRRIFHSLGVHHIVAGGQSMNPSTAQLLEAVEAAPAEEVVVLPNNKNIIPVAEQVDTLTTKRVRVVPTKGITEGFAALMEYDPQASVDDNADSMTEAAGRIRAGEVTRAVRDTTCEIGPVRQGDWMGLATEGIRAVDADLSAACIGLLEHLVDGDHEIVTIIEGDGASAGVTRHVTEWLVGQRPNVATEVHHGGQPLYPYLFGVE